MTRPYRDVTTPARQCALLADRLLTTDEHGRRRRSTPSLDDLVELAERLKREFGVGEPA